MGITWLHRTGGQSIPGRTACAKGKGWEVCAHEDCETLTLVREWEKGNKAKPAGWTLRESYIVIIKIYIKERRLNVLSTKILHML